MSEKTKLTIKQQIEYMQEQSGIQFQICSQEEAVSFLKNNNYFFKVKAYAKDYEKERESQKYKDLDFAYLIELSKIDSLLRKQILLISVDVEHFLKVGLIQHVSDNQNEDGYRIVQKFFESLPYDIKSEFTRKAQTSYCRDLVTKMDEEGYAVWNVIEVMTFGQFIRLYNFYCREYDWNRHIKNLLLPSKKLRNAAAHNNCLINSLLHPYTVEISYEIDSKVSKIPSLKKSKSRKTKLQNPVIHDFVSLLFLFDKVVTSKKTRERTYKELYELFHVRMKKHADYFSKNEVIVQNYGFMMKIVDYFYFKEYNP